MQNLGRARYTNKDSQGANARTNTELGIIKI